MDPAMLRVIFGHRIEKLTLPSGIPETMEELNLTVKQTLSIPNDFSLQYLDPENQWFSICIQYHTLKASMKVSPQSNHMNLPPQVPLHKTPMTHVNHHLQAQP